MIDINSYEDNLASFSNFQSDLLKCLGDNVFAPTSVVLCFHLIKCIKYDFKHKAGIHEDDVAKACEDLKQEFFDKFGIWEENITTISSPSIYQQFLFNLLGFEKLPAYELTNLEDLVKQDLKKRNETIKYYNETKYIQEFKAEGITPRNHDENTLHAFYIRNIDEQQKILEHLLNGIKPRAIAKAKSSFTNASYFFNPFYDRPYLTAIPNWEQYFDNRQIDIAGHRLLTVGIKEGRELRKIYSENKDEFYKRLSVLCPFDYVINSIQYYLGMLNPLSSTRKELFAELIELFKSGKYYGFYSLALSQVEGLFSEMLNKINPRSLKPSLSDKVKAIRPSYSNSDLHFDYYEYYIPTQRNKFMHSGIDDNISLKSYDLLFDLMDILSIYVSLDSPIVKLTQFVKRRDPDQYFNEEGFNEYFKLLDSSKKHPDFSKLEPEITSFEKEFLSGHLDLEALVTELSELIPQTILHLSETIKLFTKNNNGHEFVLDYWTEHSIKTKLQVLIEELDGVFSAHNDIFLKIDGYKFFLEKSLEYLPNMPDAAKQQVNLLKEKHKTDLKKIRMIIEEMASVK